MSADAGTVTTDGTSDGSDTGAAGADGGTDTGADFDWKAEAEKWKGLSRKHEDQSKGNAAAAKRLAELEAAKLTDEQRAAQERQELIAEREQLRQENKRLALATRHGIDADNIDLIGGGTDDEMEARAKRVAKMLKQSAAAAATQTTQPGPRPRPDNTQGTTADSLALNGDPLLESVKRALKIN